MCCEHGDEGTLPPAVRMMLNHYRARAAELGSDWGDETPDFDWRWLPFARFANPERVAELTISPDAARSDQVFGDRNSGWLSLILALLSMPDPLDAFVRSLSTPLPSGIALARTSGVEVGHPLPFALDGIPVPYAIFVPRRGSVPPRFAETLITADQPDLQLNGQRIRAVEPEAAGRLHLISDAPSRWSVVDERGGAWYPEDVLRKRDLQGRPFFHGNDLVLDVPASRVTVTVGRGCEFLDAAVTIAVAPFKMTGVELVPKRLYDAAAHGWYGADLHVHMNYGGSVCTPAQACLMQHGEGLHLMNLLAANQATALIYDREALESYAGRDLPWSEPRRSVARFGVEYRNDLLGHFCALNPASPPVRYQTGHRRSAHPHDWPANAVAAAEFRDVGATVNYTHVVFLPMSPDGSPERVFADERPDWLPNDVTGAEFPPEARELVADAALGLVDSIDIVGAGNFDGAEFLYHRLLGCGLRLAATAGTDTFLSQLTGTQPGWARAYADLRGAALSVEAWQEALRAGRTFATTGPWLELDVAGHGLGETIRLDGSTRLPVRAKVVGQGVHNIEIAGPDGILASAGVAPDQTQATLSTVLDVKEPMWLAAVARGGNRTDGLGPIYAHTSPIWVVVGDVSMARSTDATWCLDWLNRFEAMVRRRGTFATQRQLEDIVDVVERARAFYRAIVAAARNNPL